MNIYIEEAKNHKEMLQGYPLLKQLNPGLKKTQLSDMLTSMCKNGYRMFFAKEKNKIIGLTGYWLNTKIYSGAYLEIDNLVIDKKNRNKGAGKLLCNHAVEFAKVHHCKTIMLDAYAENNAAHRFYYREGFYVRGFHFLKHIS
jgi:GNAT superfamily N-acetyltransferase